MKKYKHAIKRFGSRVALEIIKSKRKKITEIFCVPVPLEDQYWPQLKPVQKKLRFHKEK